MIKELKEQIRLAGVIGYPLKHSKSPILHKYWLEKYQINGYYIPIELSTSNFKDGILALVKLGFRGVNITIPHKVHVLELADSITDRAAIIGAANTLYFSASGKITADNTDGFGFIKNIYDWYPYWKPKGSKAIIFGAGGASRAIIVSLLESGVDRVIILNRTRVKAQSLAESLGARVQVVDWNVDMEILRDAGLIVNTTSLGMIGQSEFSHQLDPVNKSCIAVDLVYNPIETGFLKQAKKLGLRTVDGIGMLINQAVPGFEGWFGKKPAITTDIRQLLLK